MLPVGKVKIYKIISESLEHMCRKLFFMVVGGLNALNSFPGETSKKNFS